MHYEYRKIGSFNTSRLEEHADIYILLMKGIFDAYVLWPFDKNVIFELVTRINTRDYTVLVIGNFQLLKTILLVNGFFSDQWEIYFLT